MLRTMTSFLTNLGLTVFSFLLLSFAFPHLEIELLAWTGLIPFFVVLDGKKPAVAFAWGYLLGVLFFAGMLYWIVHVTFLGLILLVLYLAVYFGLFALGYSLLSDRKPVAKLFLLPSLWVALEFVRSELFSGFGWAALGYSQYKNVVLIQIADITGMAGVSFAIVMINVLLKEYIQAVVRRDSLRLMRAPLAVGLCLIFAIVGYGFFRLHRAEGSSQGAKTQLAVIQPNIPQQLKWDDYYQDMIWEKHLELTREAASEAPELIFWPESSFPGYLWEHPRLFEKLKEFVAEIEIPVLVGIIRKVGGEYYNSAFLIAGNGELAGEYDKLHLVPFGEYLPWRGFLPFLTDIVPIDDFTPGQKRTLFPLAAAGGKKHFFSVLICFEDTISSISREFVRHGARVLVNITNDAWFKDTIEPFLHLQGSVFRAVENKRSVVRAANTGVSCFIDPYGRITKTLRGTNGKSTYVAGYAIHDVLLSVQSTFYTKFGDVFTYFCFGCILLGIILRKRLRI